MDARPPTPFAIALLVGHVVIAALTWRDLKRRPPALLRGSPALWRTLSALNTSGSLAYLLLGRRR